MQGQPGKDTSLMTSHNQQVSKVPSSSHLSVNTDDSNLEQADIGDRASVQPDECSQHDARYLLVVLCNWSQRRLASYMSSKTLLYSVWSFFNVDYALVVA